MPPAKRVKSSANSGSNAASGRPTVEDLEGQSEFATLARQHWLPRKPAEIKVNNDVLKREIWDTLEKENFPLKSLLVLEGLQALERYVGILILNRNSVDLTMMGTATCGLGMARTRPTFRFFSLS